jgi:hypothetical protein
VDTERPDNGDDREQTLTDEIAALQEKLKKHHSELDQLRIAREERERRVRERTEEPDH